jgi:hypothetical protein
VISAVPSRAAIVAPVPIAGSASTSAAEAPSALPEPGTATPQGMDDALALLYALTQKLDASDQKVSENQVTADTKAKKADLAKQQQALKSAENAQKQEQEESHSFWHKLGSIAGTVAEVGAIAGALAVTVASGGSAVVLAAVAVSAAASGLAKTGVLGDTASTILGAAGSIGLGIASLGTSTAASTVSEAVSAGTALAEATHDVSQGVEADTTAHDEANADDAQADAKAAEQKALVRQTLIDDVIAALEESHGGHQRVMQSIQGTMATNDQTSVALSHFGRA